LRRSESGHHSLLDDEIVETINVGDDEHGVIIKVDHRDIYDITGMERIHFCTLDGE